MTMVQSEGADDLGGTHNCFVVVEPLPNKKLLFLCRSNDCFASVYVCDCELKSAEEDNTLILIPVLGSLFWTLL